MSIWYFTNIDNDISRNSLENVKLNLLVKLNMPSENWAVLPSSDYYIIVNWDDLSRCSKYYAQS